MIDRVALGHADALVLDAPERDADGRLGAFRATLREPGLSAQARVQACLYRPTLPDFFAELAAAWRGWPGEKAWHSLEGELGCVARCDALGHVELDATLRPHADDDAWRAVVRVRLDAGQLDAAHRRLAAFYGA